ncbi:uncharacterized protein LOC110717085 [Chenopodium quinoa]|uniref:uncharacterized protein LOC110717085 n=1 Tax=Chenopodium quinoa TaxID=63459 RepID=UPI000B7966D6|nr:uncharacterized protein LOC110717085 [Chenopodium quinoa]
MTANCARNLNTFRIHYPLNGLHDAHIDRWVKLALSKNVANLEINLSTFYGLPKGFDIYPILRNFLFIYPGHNNHQLFLKSLHLEAICIDGRVLENVLANCLNLESLTVRTCRFYTVIVRPVKNNFLKHFELFWCHQIESLEISAPKLTSFILFSASKKLEVEYTSVPSVVNVTFGGHYCYRVLYGLHLISAFSHRLQKLSLNWNRKSRASAGLPVLPRDSLLSFIVACPLLHTFKLELVPLIGEAAVMPIALKDAKINYTMRAHRQLKVLELIGFDGSASVAEFAFCLTQNAPMLKKIICDTRCPQLKGFVNKWYDQENIDNIASARRQAKLLAKQIQRGIDVVIL